MHCVIKSSLLAVLLLSGLEHVSAASARYCAPRPNAAHALGQLQHTMANGRLVAYQPTSLQVINGQLTQVNEASIEQDLRTLRPYFDGLITYGSSNGADRIADVAARLKFRTMIIGVWEVNNASEIKAALSAAQRNPSLVVAMSLGNERIYAKEATGQQLAAAIETVRKTAPQLALTSTEPFHILLQADAAPLLQVSDFMLVNIHPVFESWFRTAPDANAAQFVTRVVDKLHAVACGPILVKETGVPTAPANLGYTPQRQASFYQALQMGFTPNALRAFAWFSAFDAPWRVNDVSPVPGSHPEEAHWGLFDDKRQAKPVMRTLTPLGR